jgi:hypothetical protein
MSSTPLIKFNTTLREFLVKLINTFPGTKTEILNHYRELVEYGQLDEPKYCHDYINRCMPFKSDIANKNEEMFKHSICLFPGIDFQAIWSSNFNTLNTKKSIWIYLDIFYALAKRVQFDEEMRNAELQVMSDEDKMMKNLLEAQESAHTTKLSQRQIFIQGLSDKELRAEIDRRKQIQSEQVATTKDEENLLNFDPQQGYSLWNSVKSFAGGKLDTMDNIFETIQETFGIDVKNIDLSNFDINNLGNMAKTVLTEENINKMKDKLTSFASEFQTDLDSGSIDKNELGKIFETIKTGLSGLSSGLAGNKNNSEDFMSKIAESSQKLFSNMIPPEMRSQFEKMQKDIMSDPSKIMQMMSDPESIAKEMFKNNPGGMNRYNDATRAQRKRDKLRKAYDEKQKAKKESSEPSDDADNTNPKSLEDK